MKLTRWVTALMMALSIMAFPARGNVAAPVSDGPFVPGEVLVKFASDADSVARASAFALVDGRPFASIPSIGWTAIRVPERLGVEAAVAALAAHPAVERVEPNHIGRIASTPLEPNDRCYIGCVGGARLWNVDAVNAPAAWGLVPGQFYTAAEKAPLLQIKVAVLDTKIDTSLVDWRNPSPTPLIDPHDAAVGGQLAMADAKDFVDASKHQGSAAYHGSFVAGILAASANNGTDVAGLGYRATIIPVTVVDGNGFATALHVAQGVDHAVAKGAKVINMSLGLSENSFVLQDAILLAISRGALPVAAAGNNANSQPFYPAWHTGVMAVTAVDHADRPGTCTNFSGQTSVAAPGVGIVSLEPSRPDRLWVAPCGTSTAAPHVSALAALLFAQNPNRSPQQVRDIIERNADDDRFRPGPDEYFGNGRVNFERALRDGVQPTVNGVVATFPKNTGGTSVVTASARATSPVAVRGAEYFLGKLGAPGTGTPLSPSDGSWGGTSETLTANIPVPLTVPTGVHRLFVRATDGSTWGPASVGVLIVDRTPPTISDFSVTPTAIPGQGVRISFRASDEFSTVGTYTFTVTRDITGLREVVFESAPATVPMPGAAVATWAPALTDAGPYEIRVTLRDEGSNPAFASGKTLVL